MENINNYYEIVEKAINSLGVNAVDCREKKQGQWSLKKSNISVWVDVFHVEREKRAYFQVMAPIVKVPTNNLTAFYKELLEINDKLYGVAFTVHKETAWIKVIRQAVGLDDTEALASITRVGNYGETYHKHLTEKFFSDDGGGGFAPGPASGR